MADNATTQFLDRQQFTSIANEALGSPAVTALELDSYFVKFIEFELEGRTFESDCNRKTSFFEFISDLFEDVEEMLNVDRFSRIFNNLGIQVSSSHRYYGIVETCAEIRGIKYTLRCFESPNSVRYELSLNFDEFCITFTDAKVISESKRSNLCDYIDFGVDIDDCHLHIDGTKVLFKLPGSVRGLRFFTDQNLTTREEAIKAARESLIYRIYKLLIDR